MNHLDEMTLFTTLVEKGSLSAAAKALQTSVSTVSRHLFSLEKRLNTRLLTRTTRKLVPTETGRLYYEHARRILEEIRDMETLLDAKVYLETWVKVKENWRDSMSLLRNFGFTEQ